MSMKSIKTEDRPVGRKAANKVSGWLCLPPNGDDDYGAALEVARRWRSQHISPTEHCFQQLLSVAQQFSGAVLSFRLKRMQSILAKLQRPGGRYQLGTMDDIGGCRLILRDINQVGQAASILRDRLELKRGNSVKNYIEEPRASGYRSCHLITSHEESGTRYRVEVQIRTQLQHLWATAVEAAGLVFNSDLKAERRTEDVGERERGVREFFAVVSSLFALEEGTPQVEGCRGSRDELAEWMHGLEILDELLEELSLVGDGINVERSFSRVDTPSLYLLRLSFGSQFLDVDPYYDQIDDAIEAYNQNEGRASLSAREDGGEGFDDVLLAYAEDFDQLGLAFPNYFANVGEFLARVRAYV